MVVKGFSFSPTKLGLMEKYMDLAKKVFEREGGKWVQSEILFKIVEEWCISKGIVITTEQTKNALTMIEFYSQTEWIEFIKGLINNLEKGSGGAMKQLWEICLEIDPKFHPNMNDPKYDIIDFLKSNLQINGE